jgi:hypothetical protein
MTEPERDGELPAADRGESQPQQRDSSPATSAHDWTSYPPEILSKLLED